LLVALAAPGCSRPAADDAAAVTSVPKVVLAVSAARVAVKPMRQELTLIGTTAALRTLTLRAPAAGRVVGLEVTTGDRVQRGEVVAHIINREEDAAQAGVEATQKTDPAEAQTLARYTGGPSIPVRVPQNTLVAQRVVSSGQNVNQFDPMVELVHPAGVYVDARAPINQLGALRAGMDATITSPLKRGVVYPARIWSLSPSFSTGGTTAPLWVQFVGADRISEIGASVEVRS
jgi:multidrug resistance efflux pump